ncbi:MAG TPA: hypothetical protein VKO61_00950 [Candidatus Paceibacterota bacterium]|nr:hypothetical protein [Candidatus Paceibacterota bacterium]
MSDNISMKNIIKDKILLIVLGVSFLFLISSLVLILVNQGKLVESLIIHVNAFQGVDMMGDVTDIWNVLLMGSLMFLINTLLIKVFYFRERIISYIILSVNFITSLFVLIKIANIISIN